MELAIRRLSFVPTLGRLPARLPLFSRAPTHHRQICGAMSPPSRTHPIHYVSASKAAAIDAALMGPDYGHTLEQLMELAGLAVAHAVAACAPSGGHVVLVCGPGNNGGDGLVAARHLRHFGYDVHVLYPRVTQRHPFPALLRQLGVLDVPVSHSLPIPEADVVVDAVFGFGFKYSPDGGIREPFGKVLKAVNEHPGKLFCVDVPSGWDVDGTGKVVGAVRKPDVLISLTAPKMCAKELDEEEGFVHYVGGRFVPRKLCQELEFAIPEYPGMDGIVRIT